MRMYPLKFKFPWHSPTILPCPLCDCLLCLTPTYNLLNKFTGEPGKGNYWLFCTVVQPHFTRSGKCNRIKDKKGFNISDLIIFPMEFYSVYAFLFFRRYAQKLTATLMKRLEQTKASWTSQFFCQFTRIVLWNFRLWTCLDSWKFLSGISQLTLRYNITNHISSLGCCTAVCCRLTVYCLFFIGSSA